MEVENSYLLDIRIIFDNYNLILVSTHEYKFDLNTKKHLTNHKLIKIHIIN